MDSEPGLFQLVYTSRRAPGVSDEDVVDEIVLPSITKNRRIAVTGCIWFDRTRFIEVLEGSEPVVRALYNTISGDLRHTGLQVLSQHAVEQRAFDRFRMRSCNAVMPASLVTLLQTIENDDGVLKEMPETVVGAVRRVVEDFRSWGSGVPT